MGTSSIKGISAINEISRELKKKLDKKRIA